jgi:hypothetical protein
VICGALALWKIKYELYAAALLNRVMGYGLYQQVTWSCLKPWNKVLHEKPVEEAEAEVKIEQLYSCTIIFTYWSNLCAL